MQFIVGFLLVLFLIWICGEILSFLFHGVLGIIVFPFHILAEIFSSPITWWILAAIVGYGLLFQSGPKVRAIIILLYLSGAAVIGYIVHTTNGVSTKDAVIFTVFWPYWTYEAFEQPPVQINTGCSGTFGEPVPCPPRMSIAE